jgi:peptidoglycan/LPS O-acetylase OafA/YrhL
MTVVDVPPLAAHRPSMSSERDTGIDFLRALCVVGVVLLHAIMVGVTVVDGSPVFANASEGTRWIIPVSWMLQVMPLFFIIGGFAGLLAYRRQSERGGTASTFVASRVHRLLRPPTVEIGVVGAALAARSLAGLPADIVATAGFRYGQPLWFLGVFLLCQALLPTLAHAHSHMPKSMLAALVLAALGIDALRALTGFDGLGFMNLAFVWLALQQIGFFLADGTVDRLSRRVRGIVGGASLTALVATFLSGVYSPDLIANINPPTCALILVGIVHLCAVSLLRDRLSDVSRSTAAAAFSRFVNRRTMTVYLWHMPVLLAMAGVSAATAMIAGLPLPEPSSLEWWLSRPLWLVAALALTAVVVIAPTSIETHPAPALSRSTRRIAAAVTIGLLAVVLLLVAGTSVLTAGVAVLGLLFARRLARGSHQSTGREGVADVVRVA